MTINKLISPNVFFVTVWVEALDAPDMVASGFSPGAQVCHVDWLVAGSTLDCFQLGALTGFWFQFLPLILVK